MKNKLGVGCGWLHRPSLAAVFRPCAQGLRMGEVRIINSPFSNLGRRPLQTAG